MAEQPWSFFPVGAQMSEIIGADIASAATIAPSRLIHRVTGTTAIVNITVPWVGFAGMLVLIPTAIWTWTAAGNIITAGTVTAGNGVPVLFFYNPDTVKWSPSRLT